MCCGKCTVTTKHACMHSYIRIVLVPMSSLLDPRTKGGVGIPILDREFVEAKIKEVKIILSRELENNNNLDMDMDFSHEQPIPAAAAH